MSATIARGGLRWTRDLPIAPWIARSVDGRGWYYVVDQVSDGPAGALRLVWVGADRRHRTLRCAGVLEELLDFAADHAARTRSTSVDGVTSRRAPSATARRIAA